MARFIANVNISTDNFNTWLQKTNQLLDAVSVDVVTTSNTTTGANTLGNTNIIGVLVANTLSTVRIIGGTPGNAAGYSTLTAGFSNATTSSNVSISGYTTNVSSNTLNIASNTSLIANTLSVNTTTSSITTTNLNLNIGNTLNGIAASANSTYSLVNIKGSNTLVNTSNFYISSITAITGNTTISGNTSVAAMTVTGNSTTTNIGLTGNTLTVSANLVVNGPSSSIAGNVAFSSNLMIIDSSNKRVGLFTTPQQDIHISHANASSLVLVENRIHSTSLAIGASNSYATGNTILVSAGSNNNIRLSTYSGELFVAANGNIGVKNTTPSSLLSIGSTVRISSNGDISTNGSVTTHGDVITEGSLYLGGNTTTTATATLSPIAAPNTTNSDTYPGPYSYLVFNNNDPQFIDIVSKQADTGYQAVKYTLQVQDNENADEVVMTEVSAIYGYNTSMIVQYGTLYTNTLFVSITSGANNTHYWLSAAPTTSYLAGKGGSANLQFRGLSQRCK